MSSKNNQHGSEAIDEDVRALMADIDASLADLEQRLEVSRAAETKTTEKKSKTAAAPAAAAAPAKPTGSDFLAELAREAQARSGLSQAGSREAEARALNEALTRIFQFLSQFCRHANALAPTIDRSYRLDGQIAYTGLRWRDASTRSRRQDLSEKSLLDHVTLSIRLEAPAPVVATRRWDQMPGLRKELDLVDLRPAQGYDAEQQVAPGMVSLKLAADFPIQLTFRANYGQNRIDMLCRNLEGFGISAFVLAPADVQQGLLDDLARYLLARSERLPQALRRVHYRSEL